MSFESYISVARDRLSQHLNMRSARTSRSLGRTLSSIGSETDDNGAQRQDSLHSSRTGSFLGREPVFESDGSSDSESDYAPPKPARQPVSVIWQDITIVSSPVSYKAVFGGDLTAKTLRNACLTTPAAAPDKCMSGRVREYGQTSLSITGKLHIYLDCGKAWAPRLSPISALCLCQNTVP